MKPIWDDGFEGCWGWGREKVDRESQLLVGRQVNERWKVFRRAYATDDEGDIVRKKLKTVWTDKEYLTERGQVAFDKLIPGRVFPSPKPVDLIKTQLLLCNDPNAIVLDFFAGSCTTAQAVLELNREDSGNRRFIMVQLPEPTPKDSAARQSGFPTIADIGKERIRRVIDAIKKLENVQSDVKVAEMPQDLGFKVFKLVEPSYNQWEPLPPETEPEEYTRQMEMMSDPLGDGWEPGNVIYEVAQKEGFSLTSQIENVEGIDDATVWRVTDGDKGQSFFICLDDTFNLETSKALNLSEDDLLICRDTALDDTTAANLALQFRLKTI